MNHVMHVRDWLRPPHRLLVVFLGVAVVSSAALGWLGWLLLEQDRRLESQRQQERIGQAADVAVAALGRSLADLESRAGPDARQTSRHSPLPAGVVAIAMEMGELAVSPAGGLLYLPIRRPPPEAPAPTFVEAERLEFTQSDLAGAAREYTALSGSGDAAVRAGALAGLARVDRRRRDTASAISAYDQLARIEGAEVGGLPTGLVARVGRASVFSESGSTSALRVEAKALQEELLGGRWPLVKPEYDHYSAQAAEWLQTTPPVDLDARARADAVTWLWENRTVLPASGRRSLAVARGPALAMWNAAPDELHAVVAGPAYLAELSSTAIGIGFRLTLSDEAGHIILGEEPRGHVAIRSAAAAGLPWTLQVFENPTTTMATPSGRRQLLMLAYAVVGLVLLAGWYFILRAMSRELRVSRLQSDFVAAVSHEFRSPLTSMSHIAEMLADDRFESDHLRRASYNVLVRDTDRLRRLVEGLLDFGRFERGVTALRIEPVDVRDLVRTTVADFRERVAPEGYSVELASTLSALPGSPVLSSSLTLTTPVVVHADREALSRALWNLLDNAVKYSPECRTVWVALELHADRVSIVVRDQGLGIPLREQREIFDRFVRGAGPKALRIKGTGIGLAMVRQIVQAHGGEIRLKSEPGHGSLFTVVLPLRG